ncbi:MAG: hypothetical protein ABTQ73_06525 [Caldilineales bacterium]
MTPPLPAAAKPRRTALLVWMILALALTLASLLIWLLMAGLSVMAFDSGVSKEAWTFVIVVWSYPILPLVLTITGWIAYARRRNRLAALLAGLAFAPPFLLYGFIAVANAIQISRLGL